MISEEYYLLCGTRPGTIMNPMTNTSEEIDECKLMPNMCSHGSCLNTPGSFECQCNRGFIYDAESHQCIGNDNVYKIIFYKIVFYTSTDTFTYLVKFVHFYYIYILTFFFQK